LVLDNDEVTRRLDNEKEEECSENAGHPNPPIATACVTNESDLPEYGMVSCDPRGISTISFDVDGC